VTRRELRSRGQDLLVGSQTISKLLFTQYGIYNGAVLAILVVVLALSCARDECGGVTCACTCPKRRNINTVIQDSCTLSPSVNKCIIICTPSIQWLYQWEPLPSYNMQKWHHWQVVGTFFPPDVYVLISYN
jgi:hypothetical protein